MVTCDIESYTGSISFTKACLSSLRGIVAFRRVSLV
jgi:hypothetical protein